MGIFDRQLINKASECKAKKEWQICVYCHAPFLTDTFETKCVRCRYFDVHLIKIKSRFIVSLEKQMRTTDDGITILPYQEFIRRLWAGEII
jgi:hypothetical protein